MAENSSSSSILTKYPSASLRELFTLSLPLILGLFSASFMGFCDRLFLSHYSIEAFEGSVSAGYLCLLFQLPIMRIATMSQVFVGLDYGSKNYQSIGPTVWQMIWLALFSILITFPPSQFFAPYFFEGSAVSHTANTYFSTMMVANFLFPLGTAISAYFIGQGRTRIIFLTTLLSHGLNVGLDYIFIFGIEGVFPSLGIFGAALATGISQAVFCVVLFMFFIRKKERTSYGTGIFHFNWNLFWPQLRIGLPRAIARMFILTAWVSCSRVMTMKGGDYLMVLSVGGTLILLFTFFNDGMLQGMITIASNLMGAKQYQKIWKLARSALISILVASALLSIPYLVFPEWTLSFLVATPPSPQTLQILKKSCIWLWLFFFCYGFSIIGISLVTASRDVGFYLISNIFVWLTSYVPVYIAMNFLNWTPDKLWLIMALDSLIYGTIFLLRSRKEKWKEIDPAPESEALLYHAQESFENLDSAKSQPVQIRKS
ncbi:MAG: hypothetical protein K1000chlam2_00523 [Chlamydiae bacterium]|nr:hypothetical protein [Chlamydiota bacterium]